MTDLSILRGHYIKKISFQSMKTKTQPRQLVLSSAEISKFDMGVMSKDLKVVNSAKKGKITIKLEKQ